ncbi:YncE family protein [Sphingosinicella rhizophila]|uniref:Cytochrome D1 domain-containing protein n=1 Tax=Sphingosinicella rhizophila TaxID=3050082 RepID=A0ABU3Q8F8_9SPHN|nr:cytochrome D1 domain-containing protein [Sphingosinicella sp. GR2756]MDT9599263.1 cytochrome D1 domain-containing protein [Sphingosinicella sp. GR2756]
MKSSTGWMAVLAISCASAAAAAPTLLVGNKGEDTLSFIDLATGKELARPATGHMPHEIAVSADGRQAAVVAYGGSTIDIFDVASRTRLRTIDLSPSERPHGLIWLDDGRLLATAEKSQTLVVVDTKADDALKAIATGQPGSHMVAVSPDKKRAYTANIPAGTVGVFDLEAGTKLRDIPVGGRPEGIALARNGRELWVGDLEGARVQAFDTQSFERLAEVKTGEVPIRVAVSPDERWVVTSNMASGSLTVIDAETRKPVREIVLSGTQDAAQVTIIFSADGKRLYAAETGRAEVAEGDFTSGKVLRRLSAGKDGDGLAVAP